MLKKFKRIFVLLLAVVLSLTIFTGCIQVILPSDVLTIEKTGTDGYVDTYTITYTDGRTSTFTITNGRNGIDGEDGVVMCTAVFAEDFAEGFVSLIAVGGQRFLRHLDAAEGHECAL